MPSQTWVARFVVDHGRVTEEGGRLRTFPRRRLDEPEIDLHILAEPAGPKGEDFGTQAIETIGREFVNDTLSLTGGLIRALRSTNTKLIEWNRRSIAKDQVSVGVTAAVVRGSVVYLAQAGPTLVYLRRGGKFARLVPEEAARVALGDGQIEPELRRVDMHAGDVVLAASEDLDRLIDSASLEDLLERGTDVALPELYLRTRELPNFALFAITCLDEAAAAEPAPAASPNVDAFLQGGDSAEPDPAAEPPPDNITAGHASTASVQTAALPAPLMTAPRPRLTLESTSLPSPVLSFDAPSRAPAGRPPVLVAPAPLDISRPVVKLRSDQFSSRGDYPRTTGAGRPFRLQTPAPGMLGIAVVAALAIFIAAFTVPDLIQEKREVQASTLIERALVAYSDSVQAQDKAQQRHLLEETRRLTTEALRIEPANIEATELHAQATGMLTGLNNIFDLGPMQTLTTLGRQVTGEVAIDRMVVAGGNAYLLDTRGRRILMVPIATQGPPAVLFEEGQTYGGAAARRPQFMTWDATSNRLLVLDSERRLFEIRPGTVQSLALRRSASWASVAGLSAYDGNLYVLDPKGNQIHRYLPAASGYDSEPQALLGSQAKIADVVALSVQADVFLLDQGGAVRRIRNGVESTLPLSGIDRPLASPSSIAAIPNSDEVFIADTGNKRVVVANREGVFGRQLVSNAFTDLRTIAIDPIAGQIYAVVGDALLTAPLVR